MALMAVSELDSFPAVGGDMFIVVAASATGPIFMAYVIRIIPPTGLHFGEEIVGVDLLNRCDSLVNLGCPLGRVFSQKTTIKFN
jgi:hypothetical protein